MAKYEPYDLDNRSRPGPELESTRKEALCPCQGSCRLHRSPAANLVEANHALSQLLLLRHRTSTSENTAHAVECEAWNGRPAQYQPAYTMACIARPEANNSEAKSR